MGHTTETKDVVPVLNLDTLRDRGRGNPYRRYDTENESWETLASKDEWLSAERPHVKLEGGGRYDPEAVQPVHEFDGHLPELPEVIRDAESGDDGLSINVFGCPECGTELVGFPDACPKCDAPYQWE